MPLTVGDSIDWVGAEDTLYAFSKAQVLGFLAASDRSDVYGIGFFCDPIEGVMLAANTLAYHDASIRRCQEAFGSCDGEQYKWDTGNWEYPAGLYDSSSVEQNRFDSEWQRFREPLSRMENDEPERLERLCIRVLKRLKDEGVFSSVTGLEGFMVLGPDDPSDRVLEKKKRLDDPMADPV